MQIYQIRILPNTDMAAPDYIKKHQIETIWVPIQSKHGALLNGEEVQEMEEMIIKTSTMSTSDWKKMLELAWFIQAFFCLKLSYFINLFLKEQLNLKVTEFGVFMIDEVRKNASLYPRLGYELNRLNSFIETYVQGNPKVDVSDLDLPEVNWPIEEATFIKLSLHLDEFYNELRQVTDSYMKNLGILLESELLAQVFEYQKARIVNTRGPYKAELKFDYNLPEFFEAAMLLNPISLQKKESRVKVIANYSYQDLSEFARYHVWYGRQGKPFYYKVSLEATGEATGETTGPRASDFFSTDTTTPVPAIST